MTTTMRPSTLESLGLGTVLSMVKAGQLPVSTAHLVDRIFGPAGERRAMVISGANGIVGAGKAMQLGARLVDYGVPLIALDMAGAPDGLSRKFAGLKDNFGVARASLIMENIIRMSYDGRRVPDKLKQFNPAFLLEAIPEKLELKKGHYALFKEVFPHITIRSVTSGFPRSELGVSIAHPAFPHEINKVWEIVEPEPSAVTQLFWSMGLIPVAVNDHWSFVLDVLFCGLALAGLRYQDATNMPPWKIDKYIRRLLGPNPFRAHDAIGVPGANYLTWSCLHHLSKVYGPLFTPTESLEFNKSSGMTWYPLNHFRPLVDWPLSKAEESEFVDWIVGPLAHMTSIMIQEKRAALPVMNAIGELCAQFNLGNVALLRRYGRDWILNALLRYHTLYPPAAETKWYPKVFDEMSTHEWQQLYVNAEHDGLVGMITISRENYNHEVDQELNRAMDWLLEASVRRVIISGDFHLSTQMVGAYINDFFPALEDVTEGEKLAASWTRTVRRLHQDFEVSIGLINGKRCLGGMLEMMAHCHYVITRRDSQLGMPEVTLPVVPGMDGCHWLLRKASQEHYGKIINMLLSGTFYTGADTVGWLTDYAGSIEDCLKMAWEIATGQSAVPRRELDRGALDNLPDAPSQVDDGNIALSFEGRKAIWDSIRSSCACDLEESLAVQSQKTAAFFVTKECHRGKVGAAYNRTMKV